MNDLKQWVENIEAERPGLLLRVIVAAMFIASCYAGTLVNSALSAL